MIAAALGAYLYHPGKWSLIIPIVLVALFERFIARNPYRQEDDAPPAAGSDTTGVSTMTP